MRGLDEPLMTSAQACLAEAGDLWARRQTPQALIHLQKGLREPWPLQDRLQLAHCLAQWLIKLGRTVEARRLVVQAQSHASREGLAMPEWVTTLAWMTLPAWWEPLTGRGLLLRRLSGVDAPWLKSLFADDSFANLVNREFGLRVRASSEALIATQLQAQHSRPPVDLGALVLLVQTAGGRPLGLASLVAIDEQARRAEFIIGFPPDTATAYQVMATGALMLDFAFWRVGFHKVVSVIYGDNPRLGSLVESLQAVGFASEGVQRQHVHLSGGGYVDLHLMGALREEVQANPTAVRLIRRYVPSMADRGSH